MKKLLLVLALMQIVTMPIWEKSRLPSNYHGQNDSMEYNPYQQRYERAQPGSELQYNPYQNEWSYKQPGYNFEYNPYSNKWE